jgi:hypothetical protein
VPGEVPSKTAKLEVGDESDGAGASALPPDSGSRDHGIPVPADESEPEPDDSDLLPAAEDWPKNAKENVEQKFLVTIF